MPVATIYSGAHTPGPWEVDDENWIYAGGELPGTMKLIATCPPNGQGDINAALIAAAPDLLAACAALMESGSNGSLDAFMIRDANGFNKACQQIEAALAKATGAK